METELTFTVAQHSVPGKKPENEDAIDIRIPQASLLRNKGAVAVIADSVSAAEAGKEASETCVHNFLNDYYSTPDSWGVKKSTTKVLTALNRWLFSQGRQFSDAKKGYVSTFSAIIFKSQTAHVFHVGDSRIYQFRKGELEQLTRDHTTYISSEQSYLSRAMGLDVMLDVDYKSVDVEIGDIYLLTTDGIHDFVKDTDLRASLNLLASEKNEEKFIIETSRKSSIASSSTSLTRWRRARATAALKQCRRLDATNDKRLLARRRRKRARFSPVLRRSPAPDAA